MCAEGIIANDADVKELNRIPEKFRGCRAKLFYLDLAGCSFVDSRIISPIVKLQNHAEKIGSAFEVRVADWRLFSFFKTIELDKIAKIDFAGQTQDSSQIESNVAA